MSSVSLDRGSGGLCTHQNQWWLANVRRGHNKSHLLAGKFNILVDIVTCKDVIIKECNNDCFIIVTVRECQHVFSQSDHHAMSSQYACNVRSLF